jgi:hypothetical protein
MQNRVGEIPDPVLVSFIYDRLCTERVALPLPQ